jgi:hypothetical protein
MFKMQHLEVSGAVRHIYMTLGSKGLKVEYFIYSAKHNEAGCCEISLNLDVSLFSAAHVRLSLCGTTVACLAQFLSWYFDRKTRKKT